jgi:MerR family mercuric resistance operon transcriptional regulator
METIPHDIPWLPIGALSKRTGCNIETIRWYEKVGLLPAPARTEGRHRMYGTVHLQRLSFIRRARELGFTLDEVRALLRLADRHDGSCAQARDLAVSHLADVQAKIADLKLMERVLKGMIASCADGTLPECPLIESLFQRAESKPKGILEKDPF